MLIGLTDRLDIRGEWEGDFWLTYLIGWWCCYSDEKNWKRGRLGEGGSESQFCICCFHNVWEASKWRHQAGSWGAQGVYLSSRKRSGLKFTLQPSLVNLPSHLFPINAFGRILWITITSWLPDPMDHFQSHLPQPLCSSWHSHIVLETHHVAFMTPLAWFSLFLWMLCQLLLYAV